MCYKNRQTGQLRTSDAPRAEYHLFSSEGSAVMFSKRFALILMLFIAPLLLGQNAAQPAESAQSPAQPATASPQASSGPVSSTARLRAARKVCVRERGRGSHIPFNVISSAFSSWPRFVVVDRPEDADLLVEVYGPEDPGSLSIQGPLSGSSGNSSYDRSNENRSRMHDGMAPNVPGRDNTGDMSIKMAVRDARNGFPLWNGKELPKGAMKQRAKEDNIVAGSQKLFYRFRDLVEPAESETPTEKK
jgi:hypothetical protein